MGMRHPVVSVSVAVLGMMVAVGSWPAAGEAAEILDVRESIVVRTYTPSALEGSIDAVRRTAAAILGHAGLDVTWVECQLPEKRAVACAQPLQWNELVVRIVAASPTGDTDNATLGYAAVDLGTGRGTLATVYADRAALMARAAGVETADLLGRAVAHEIGHLLLGSNRHASRGVMRAHWSATDLRRSLANQWLFVDQQGALMRKAVASRRPHRS